MLTYHQQKRAVHALTEALCAFTTAECANERARNLVQALDDATDSDRHSVICGTLLIRSHEIREFWKAADAAEIAFVMSTLDDNLARFAWLTGDRRLTAEDASAYLQRHGWTVSEGTARA